MQSEFNNWIITTYTSKEKFLHHAEDQVGPEYVQHQQDDKNSIKEVIPEENRVIVRWVDPRTVDDPETKTTEMLQSPCYRKLQLY